jgi:hypothetical protein
MRYLTRQHSFLARAITLTRYEAKNRRNLEFDIDLAYLIDILQTQNNRCALTGWELEFTHGGGLHRTNPLVCTMDRINNNLGYIRGNIQLTCWQPNKIKNDMSNEDFIKMCKAVTIQCG